MNQIELHKKIEEIVKAGPDVATGTVVREIVASNEDARRYFYAKADESWLNWLWENNFLDVIRQKAEDPTKYSYRTSELDYLVRISEKIPSRVVDFVLNVSISRETFNPEVVDRFLWLCSRLPADQLKRVVPKIRDERWIQLMGPFNRWSFEYKQMFDTLAAADDQANIIMLADAVLSVRSTEDIKKGSFGSVDNPFYFNDLHHSEVFERLSEIGDAHAEDVLSLVLKTLKNIVLLADKEDGVFKIGDSFSLIDLDFFTLELGFGRHYSARDDVRDLAAIAKLFVDKLIGGTCGNVDEVRRLYNSYIVPLPDARTIWRFRLYIWSLCPDIFKDELTTAFFRGIESDKTLWPLTGGAEYDEALKKSFYVLSEVEKRKYIDQAFNLFEGMDTEHPYGFGVLSSIHSSLSVDDKNRAAKLYKQPIVGDFIPSPSVGHSYGGTVVPQTPPNSEDVWDKSVPEIVQHLKTDWSPSALQKIDKQEDYLRPINAEGIANKLVTKIKERLPEYVNNAPLFFDRDLLDAHYTYSFLRGIQEAIRANYKSATEIDWSPLIIFGKSVAASGTAKAFDLVREREKFDAWLSGWNGVLSSLADVLKELLKDENEKTIIDFNSHRQDLIQIIRFLFSYPDPQPADEKLETAKMKTKSPEDKDYQVSDPLSIAINTTRGRVFETFVYFVQQDGKKFPKDAKSRISDDIKQLYVEVLKREDTRAIMFMFGNYIAFFYYRDMTWMETLFPIIFSREEAKKDLYLAAWEGYLSSALYFELFTKLHDEYARAIVLDPASYTKRRYRNELDDGLATHLALAYIHFKEFEFETDLYKAFWTKHITNRWSEFISFIGRSVISRDRPKEWLKEHPEVSIKKLEAFWDWALIHCEDKEALKEFGFWMQVKDDIFDPIWLAERIDKTLEKTEGDIDWEIGFMDSMPLLSKTAPEKTLSALHRHLIQGKILQDARGYIREGNLIEILTTLYQNPSTKQGTYDLINELLPIGVGQFWGLKEIIK